MNPQPRQLQTPALAGLRDRLRAAFGPMPASRRRDPVGQLVRSILGARTPQAVADSVFVILRARFWPWPRLADARPDEVSPLIAPVAQADDKAQRLVAALAQVRREAGSVRLDWLEAWPVDDAMDWLRQLPGVGEATAAAVLNASTLRRSVLVVDAEVLRAARRLGLAAPHDSAGACRKAVGEAAPDGWEADDFTELHALLKRLSQAFCRIGAPDCGGCPVRSLCPYPTGGEPGAPSWGLHASAPLAANENMRATEQALLHHHLRRRIARMGQGGVSSRVLRDGAVGLGRPELDAAFTDSLLPPGLHQSAGARPEDGAAALVLPLAAILAAPRPKAGRRVLVVQEADARRERGDLHGPGLEALGLAPAEAVFVRVRDGPEAMRVADEAVRSRAAPAVLLDLRRGGALADLALTRRFNLAARQAGLFVFLVTSDLEGTSAAATRWRIASAPSRGARRRLGPPAFHLDLVRNRQGRTGRWLVEWSAHERRFLSARPLAPADGGAGDRVGFGDPGAAFPAPVGAEAVHRPSAA